MSHWSTKMKEATFFALNGLDGNRSKTIVVMIRENPIPFHQIREIRNPWNRNQEVKVSRDGTEIEPSVGAILLAAFDAKPDCLPQASRSNVSGSPTRHSPMRLPPPAQFQPNAANAIVYPHTTIGSPDQGLTYFQYGAIQRQPVQYNYGRIIY
jgi:hypothetical protein